MASSPGPIVESIDGTPEACGISGIVPVFNDLTTRSKDPPLPAAETSTTTTEGMLLCSEFQDENGHQPVCFGTRGSTRARQEEERRTGLAAMGNSNRLSSHMGGPETGNVYGENQAAVSFDYWLPPHIRHPISSSSDGGEVDMTPGFLPMEPSWRRDRIRKVVCHGHPLGQGMNMSALPIPHAKPMTQIEGLPAFPPHPPVGPPCPPPPGNQPFVPPPPPQWGDPAPHRIPLMQFPPGCTPPQPPQMGLPAAGLWQHGCMPPRIIPPPTAPQEESCEPTAKTAEKEVHPLLTAVRELINTIPSTALFLGLVLGSKWIHSSAVEESGILPVLAEAASAGKGRHELLSKLLPGHKLFSVSPRVNTPAKHTPAFSLCGGSIEETEAESMDFDPMSQPGNLGPAETPAAGMPLRLIGNEHGGVDLVLVLGSWTTDDAAAAGIHPPSTPPADCAAVVCNEELLNENSPSTVDEPTSVGWWKTLFSPASRSESPRQPSRHSETGDPDSEHLKTILDGMPPDMTLEFVIPVPEHVEAMVRRRAQKERRNNQFVKGIYQPSALRRNARSLGMEDRRINYGGAGRQTRQVLNCSTNYPGVPHMKSDSALSALSLAVASLGDGRQPVTAAERVQLQALLTLITDKLNNGAVARRRPLQPPSVTSSRPPLMAQERMLTSSSEKKAEISPKTKPSVTSLEKSPRQAWSLNGSNNPSLPSSLPLHEDLMGWDVLRSPRTANAEVATERRIAEILAEIKRLSQWHAYIWFSAVRRPEILNMGIPARKIQTIAGMEWVELQGDNHRMLSFVESVMVFLEGHPCPRAGEDNQTKIRRLEYKNFVADTLRSPYNDVCSQSMKTFLEDNPDVQLSADALPKQEAKPLHPTVQRAAAGNNGKAVAEALVDIASRQSRAMPADVTHALPSRPAAVFAGPHCGAALMKAPPVKQPEIKREETTESSDVDMKTSSSEVRQGIEAERTPERCQQASSSLPVPMEIAIKHSGGDEESIPGSSTGGTGNSDGSDEELNLGPEALNDHPGATGSAADRPRSNEGTPLGGHVWTDGGLVPPRGLTVTSEEIPRESLASYAVRFLEDHVCSAEDEPPHGPAGDDEWWQDPRWTPRTMWSRKDKQEYFGVAFRFPCSSPILAAKLAEIHTRNQGRRRSIRRASLASTQCHTYIALEMDLMSKNMASTYQQSSRAVLPEAMLVGAAIQVVVKIGSSIGWSNAIVKATNTKDVAARRNSNPRRDSSSQDENGSDSLSPRSSKSNRESRRWRSLTVEVALPAAPGEGPPDTQVACVSRRDFVSTNLPVLALTEGCWRFGPAEESQETPLIRGSVVVALRELDDALVLNDAIVTCEEPPNLCWLPSFDVETVERAAVTHRLPFDASPLIPATGHTDIEAVWSDGPGDLDRFWVWRLPIPTKEEIARTVMDSEQKFEKRGRGRPRFQDNLPRKEEKISPLQGFLRLVRMTGVTGVVMAPIEIDLSHEQQHSHEGGVAALMRVFGRRPPRCTSIRQKRRRLSTELRAPEEISADSQFPSSSDAGKADISGKNSFAGSTFESEDDGIDTEKTERSLSPNAAVKSSSFGNSPPSPALPMPPGLPARVAAGMPPPAESSRECSHSETAKVPILRAGPRNTSGEPPWTLSMLSKMPCAPRGFIPKSAESPTGRGQSLVLPAIFASPTGNVPSTGSPGGHLMPGRPWGPPAAHHRGEGLEARSHTVPPDPNIPTTAHPTSGPHAMPAVMQLLAPVHKNTYQPQQLSGNRSSVDSVSRTFHILPSAK